MDVVIRTTHGEAEVSVGRPDGSTTLGELVERVVGRPPPPVVDIDGRATATGTRLDRCGILTGSVIDVDHRPSDAIPAAGAAPAGIELVVVGGPGTGSRSPLAAGRYRVGPGRRVHAEELAPAAVDLAVFELDVDAVGDVILTVPDGEAGGSTLLSVRLDGNMVGPGRTTRWRDGVIDVADRAFELHSTVEAGEQALRPAPDADGRVPFERSPGEATWRRRASDPDALRLPIGLHVGLPGPPGLVTVDLAVERGIGVSGNAEFTRAFASALIVDACTRLGPADLDLVVLTEPGRAAAWEWVKWLPHTRVDDLPGPYSSQTDVAAWLARSASGARRWSANRYHVTLVIIDEHAWWHGRSAPLHPMLDDHALPLRFVVLGSTPESLPVACGTVVRERRDDGATLDAAEGHEHIERFLPFLAAPGWARRAALALAPLDDQALLATEHTSSWPSSSFAEAVDLDATDELAIAARWRAGDGLRIMIGDAGEGPVRLDLDANGPHAVVAGVDAAGMRELLRTIVAGITATNSPDDVTIALVDEGDGDVFGPCVDLPHVVRRIFHLDERGVIELVARLRAEVESRGDAIDAVPALVVIVHTAGPAAGGTSTAVSNALADFAVWAGQTSVHLVVAVTADENDAPPIVDARLAAHAGTRVALRVRHDADSLALVGDVAAARIPHHDPGRGVLATARGRVVPFRTITTSGPARSMQAWPDVRPFVVARDSTPMERRLVAAARAESRLPGDGTATVIDRVVEAIGAAAAMPSEHRVAGDRRPTLPLPAAADLDDLLEWFPGDGVPYALVDDPAAGFTDPRGDLRRARWWEPGAAAIAIRAADRASRDLVTDWIAALVLGVASRTGEHDVELHVVTAQPGRLAALAHLPQVATVAGPSDPQQVLSVARALNAAIAERRAGTTAGPAVVPLIDRLELLRNAVPVPVWEELHAVLRDGPAVGIRPVVTLDDSTVFDVLDVLPVHDWTVSVAGASDRTGVRGLLARPPVDLSSAVRGGS